MYPGVYRPMVPPRCPHCTNGKRLTPLTGRLVDCDECNGTGIAGNTRLLFIVVLFMMFIYGVILLWFLW